VAADRHQTSADECDVGGRVEIQQFTQGVEQQHLALLGSAGGSLRAAHEAHAGLMQQCRDLGESLRMTRRQHQQRVRVRRAHAPLRLEQRLLLAPAVRAAGHPQRPGGRVLLTQPRAALHGLRRQLEVELEIAGHVGAGRICAQRPEALGISAALGRDHGRLRQGVAEQGSQAPIAADRARRDARARQNQRHAPPSALAVQVRPQLGLDYDREPRLHAREEAPHRAGQIKRDVTHLHRVAEQRTRPRGPGGRNSRDGQRQVRMALPQRAHQRRAGLHLTDRRRVYPHPVPRRRRAEAEALAKVAPVAAIAQAAPQKHGRDDRSG
jgi:hypothetical protein